MLRENHINRESKARSSQFGYIDVMNMNILAVVTLPFIYQNKMVLDPIRDPWSGATQLLVPMPSAGLQNPMPTFSILFPALLNPLQQPIS